MNEIDERKTEDDTHRPAGRLPAGGTARAPARDTLSWLRGRPRRLGRLLPALVLCILGYLFFAFSQPDPAKQGEHVPPPGGFARVQLARFAEGFSYPVHLISPPGDTSRIFVVEKTGKIRIIKDGVTLERPFIDLSSRLDTRNEEQGLLSLAFHPRYAENRRFYVNFTDRQKATRIVEYRAHDHDPDLADVLGVREILRIPQPWRNHNGGHSLFGPDGFLWIGTGDGGAAGDPQGNGQDLSSLLGKILRIDVDAEGGPPYRSPPSNPFVGTDGARPEIWAYGVRNPWRMAFDRKTGDFYFGDVGQNRYEEVNAVPASSRGGENYGWAVVEGLGHCYGARTCDQTGMTLPVVEYGRGVGGSVTGGHVYRGEAVPELQGIYFYADYSSGAIRSFRFRDGKAVDRWDWTERLNGDGRVRRIASFGEDAAGELYVVSHDGPIYRFVRTGD